MKQRRLSVRRSECAGILWAAVVASMPIVASAGNPRTWASSVNGNWSNANDWSPVGVPSGPLDAANITATNGIGFTVNYDYSGTLSTISQLTVDLAGAGSSSATFAMSGNTLTLSASTVIDGNSGRGAINQSAGGIGVGSLLLGNSSAATGTYTLSGTGTLTSAGVAQVGVSGMGVFTQSGGVSRLNAGMNIGSQAGSNGTYDLSAGNVTLAAGESIGFGGTGTFIQSGGTMSLTNSQQGLYIGYGTGSSGNFTLGGGFVNVAQSMYVGGSNFGAGGQGILNVTGGVLNVGVGMTVYNSGGTSVNINGGAVNANLFFDDIGNVDQEGGTLTTGDLISDTGGGNSPGNYVLSGGGSIVATNETVNGEFTQYVGSNNVGTAGNLIINSLGVGGGGYEMFADGGVLTASTEYVGYNGTGSFDQEHASINTMGTAGSLHLGTGVGSTGTYYMLNNGDTSGQLIAGNEFIGEDGVGDFIQNGDTNTVGTLTLGVNSGATGSYTLMNFPNSNGALSAAVEYIGYSGTGTFVQAANPQIATNSQNNVGLLYIGFNIGSTGSYTLSTFSMVQITANSEFVSYNGTGSFFQGGGTNTVGSLLIGSQGVPGIYTLSGGTLSAGLAQVVSGQFIQSGGVFNGTLQIQSTFIYQGGQFNGRLINQGNSVLGNDFTAGNGIENDVSMSLLTGQVLTVNGQGLDNLGTFSVAGGTINGAGPALNDFSGNMSGFGTINNSFINKGLFTLAGILRFGSSASNGGIMNGNGDIIGNFSNSASGTMDIAGTLPLAITNTWTNSGLVQMQGGQLGGGTITNAGTIQGYGNINAVIANNGIIRAAGGELDLAAPGITNGSSAQIQVATGGTNFFSAGLAINNGTIAMTGGSFDNNNQPITNSSTGHISGWGTFSSGGLANNGNFNVGGNLNVFGPVTNNAAGIIHATDSGLNAFFGPVVNNGSLIVNAGSSVMFFNSFTGTGVLTNNGAVAFNAGGSTPGILGGGLLSIGSTVTFTSNSTTSTQSALNISNGSVLNINNNALRINFGSPAADPVATIAGYLVTGFNHGTWTGTGIDSSTAAGNPSVLSVGYADGNVDAGTTAQANQLLIKYTLAGDANLDGLVNFNDLVAVVQNFNKAGTDWAHGNFQYAASTNFNDLVAVIQNFNKTLTPAGSSDSSLGGSAIALFQSADIQPTVVRLPEPGVLGILTVCAGGLLCRRRQRK